MVAILRNCFNYARAILERDSDATKNLLICSVFWVMNSLLSLFALDYCSRLFFLSKKYHYLRTLWRVQALLCIFALFFNSHTQFTCSIFDNAVLVISSAKNLSNDSYLKMKKKTTRNYCQIFKYKNKRVKSEINSFFRDAFICHLTYSLATGFIVFTQHTATQKRFE